MLLFDRYLYNESQSFDSIRYNISQKNCIIFDILFWIYDLLGMNVKSSTICGEKEKKEKGAWSKKIQLAKENNIISTWYEAYEFIFYLCKWNKMLII